jgi:hypothetical protein
VSPPAERGRPGVSTLIVLFLAFFALALAILLRTFVAGQLLVAPADQYSKAKLEATNAIYFDASTVSTRTGAVLTLTSTLRGDVKAAKDGNVVWDSFLALEDLQNQKQVKITEERLAFDKKTAELVNCCKTTAKVAGGGPAYGLFFPVGIEKKTYNVYDSSTARAWPMRFVGTETKNGTEVYRFTQQIPETNVGKYERAVPSTLLGIPGKARDIPVDQYYRAEVTSWIEPRSGVTVDRRQQITSKLKGQDGQGELVVADADLKMSEATQKELADKADEAATSATFLRTTGPAISLGVSVLLFVLGALLLARHRRTKALASEPF